VTIKKFLLFSIVFHLVLFLGIYFVPEPKIKKAREFITSLVSPEELIKPEIRARPLPTPVPRPIPRQKVFPGPLRPLPPLPHLKRIIPGRPPLPLEEPVVPGEGKETGRPLPEGMRPRETDGGKSAVTKEEGDAKDTKDAITSGKPGFSARRSFKEITEAMAKKDLIGPGGRTKKDDTVTFDTEDYRYAGYMRNLREKIESIWVYPPEAAARGIYGDLKIQFTIKKDGRLSAIELVRTSGHKMLDDAAIKALKDGEPYWPLPDSWGKDSYTILGHFVYVYGGYYIK
jgi:protein TonB